MEEITLQALLEAGCHFGHKSERWHPKASQFIYAEKDGIHIIDLAKTKAGLEQAVAVIKDFVSTGQEILFVGTKRQARSAIKEAATSAHAPYLSERWIGGFLTNWEGIKKNIEKTNRLMKERENGEWKKYPKHEQSKLGRELDKLLNFYGGVLGMTGVPSALFVIDIRKEESAVREAQRVGIPVIAVVDSNSDPSPITYVIPANDDAVGSIEYISRVMGKAYKESREKRQKDAEKLSPKVSVEQPGEVTSTTTVEKPSTDQKEHTKPLTVEAPKKKSTTGKIASIKNTAEKPVAKRGRPKKS